MNGGEVIEIVGGILDGQEVWVSDVVIGSGYLIVDEGPISTEYWSREGSRPTSIPRVQVQYSIVYSHDSSRFKAVRPKYSG